MGKTIKIGVDVGNYDVKTQNTTSPSGYKEYIEQPSLAQKYLYFNGKYYVQNVEARIPYEMDKTKSEQCIILTLFGIAEEILFIIKNQQHYSTTEDIQREISSISEIKLGVGLPPGHYGKLLALTEEYYKRYTDKPLSFKYGNYTFNIAVNSIRIFPQDFIAVYKNKNCQIQSKYKKYYIVGIGGGTVDYMPVVNGSPDVNNCKSWELGTRIMYENLIADVQRQIGDEYDEYLIESVLKGEPTIIGEDAITIINNGTKNHATKILNKLKQIGANLRAYPVVFFGGGALLLKNAIEERSDLLGEYEFISDVNANAKAYADNVK